MLISNTEGILLICSLALLTLFIIYNLKRKKKKLFNYLYVIFSAALFIWVGSLLGMKYTDPDNMVLLYVWDSLSNVASTLVPVIMLSISIVYTQNRVRLTKKFLLLLIIPVISIIVVWTNPFHHIFYKTFSILAEEVEFGFYMYINAIYSYGCLIAALYLMIRFAIKNSRYYLKQILIFCTGNLLPMIVSLLATLQVFNLSITATPLSFIITIIMHGLAIFRFQFLNLTPIALENILNRISDSYAVINDRMLVVDYNKQLMDMFGSLYNIRRNASLVDILNENKDPETLKAPLLLKQINRALRSNRTIKFETSIRIEDRLVYLYFEISPITIQNVNLGFIILIRDITQSKMDMERLKQNQAMLMERERLASLGQMIGGIAHNLKTPIMSLSGGIMALENLIQEYKDSIPDKSVTKEDHIEIAEEMASWTEKMKPYCGYMSDIISTVKDQAVQMNASTEREFTIDELIKRVRLLMKHELNTYHCKMIVLNRLKSFVLLRGDINNLVQILDNFIINAIDAYGGKGGTITFTIYREKNDLFFRIKDSGSGIPKDVQAKLFKEMFTTKGAQGTGLGLFMSYGAIKGKFGGDVTLESKEGQGATFYIRIPINVKSALQNV